MNHQRRSDGDSELFDGTGGVKVGVSSLNLPDVAGAGDDGK